jgi:hypothetical protein
MKRKKGKAFGLLSVSVLYGYRVVPLIWILGLCIGVSGGVIWQSSKTWVRMLSVDFVGKV